MNSLFKFRNSACVSTVLTLFLAAQAEAADNPKIGVGEKVPPFEAKTTDGKAVKFPSDYKGKGGQKQTGRRTDRSEWARARCTLPAELLPPRHRPRSPV